MIASQFPQFLWVVRDFALKLVDLNNNPITQKDYLEQSLQLHKGSSDSVESKNKIRRLLKHFFRDRDCVTMVRPVESENMLQYLDTMDTDRLRPE